MTATSPPRVSVVVATYNRLDSLLDLLGDLSRQTLATDRFEVVLIDDGSAEAVAPYVERLGLPYPLRHRRQANAGQSAARQAGVELAQGDVVVILDDDMHVPPTFLENHLRYHDAGYDVVLGHIHAPDDEGARALFERFHMDQLKQFVRGVREGRIRVKGVHLCTGNVSFRRQLFLEVGGFDTSLKRSEDRELGVRFEVNGAKLVFGEDAVSYHKSDHQSLDVWLGRAFNYGIYDRKISKKHEAVESADPWRFFFLVSPVSRPLLFATVAMPPVGKRLSRLGMTVSDALDRTGLSSVALKGVTLSYGLEYFRGMREEAGSLRTTLQDLARYLDKRAGAGQGSALLRFAHAVTTDYRYVQRHRETYRGEAVPMWRLPVDAVRKVGFQMMCAIRLMQLFEQAGVPLAPQLASRLIRLAYGADVHWRADIRPGVCIVHGMGLVISEAARIERGAILFHNVTLGMSRDGATGEVGAPHLEEDVHVGPGSTLLGPITVGAGSKLMAGSVLSRSVPQGSVVRPAGVEVEPRRALGREPLRRAERLRADVGAKIRRLMLEGAD